MFPLEYRIWNGTHMLDALMISIENNEIEVQCPLRNKRVKYRISDVILMPYTGLRDSKYQKIYASDIVQVSHLLIENSPSYYALVVWDKYRFTLRTLNFEKYKFQIPPYTNLDPFALFLTTIGNSLKNPELVVD